MLPRFKSFFPFIYIPALVIVGANLLGLASIFLIPLLNRTSQVILPILDPRLLIFLPLIVFLVFYLIRDKRHRSYRIDFPGDLSRLPEPIRRKSPAKRWISAFILLCVLLPFLVLLCVFVHEALSGLFTSSFFKKYNLALFLVLILGILQFELRSHVLRSMTWKKLSMLWLKPPTISAITVGGFGFIATSDAIKNPLLQLTLKSEYTNLPLIVPTAFCGILLMLFALIIERIGRTRSADDDRNIPHGWFYTAFGLAFGGNIAMFGLLLNSIFLTIQTHYASQSLTGT